MFLFCLFFLALKSTSSSSEIAADPYQRVQPIDTVVLEMEPLATAETAEFAKSTVSLRRAAVARNYA
jgi:hypothetical protein